MKKDLDLSFQSCLKFHFKSECAVIYFPDGSVVKNLSAKQETWVQSLGWEDPLEKEMATHSSILAWEILWTEEPGGLQSMGVSRVGHNLATKQQHSVIHKLVDSLRFCL